MKSYRTDLADGTGADPVIDGGNYRLEKSTAEEDKIKLNRQETFIKTFTNELFTFSLEEQNIILITIMRSVCKYRGEEIDQISRDINSMDVHRDLLKESIENLVEVNLNSKI